MEHREARGSSAAEITIAGKMTRVTENRSGAAPAEGCGEFSLSLSLVPAPYSGISKFPQERALCEI